ncbi:MAG: dienelactone hydrolase family protein [Candidatus Marinimicrobia bacterium]|nr:dienelactone hydrolase family protein [Candidatus Neomarinimicrobiota bacterium]
MKNLRVFILVTLFAFSFAIEASPEALALFDAKTFINEDNDTLLYRMLEPQKKCPLKKYPLVIFLHGSGERGNDNERQLIWGAGAFIKEENLKKYPCYVVAPQCPAEKRWLEINWALPTHIMPDEPSETMALVMELIDQVIDNYPINIHRIYVTGLSMGGYGTWDLISRIPERIAAAAPVCGGADENQAPKLVDMPIWVFHGADDTTVPPDRSRHMVQAIKDAGGTKIKFTEYPGVGHGSWKLAYADPEFLKWMFKQKKSR